MKFAEYLATLRSLWSDVTYEPSTKNVGFVQAARAWNHEAIFRPENCEDIVVFRGNQFALVANPYKTDGSDVTSIAAVGDADGAKEKKAAVNDNKRHKVKYTVPDFKNDNSLQRNDTAPSATG